MDCPLCDRVHEVEERTRTANITIKGESISYQERFYYCIHSSEDECEFETGNMANFRFGRIVSWLVKHLRHIRW